MKTCSKCKVEKELIEFVERKSSKDGFRNQCKKCLAINSKNYRKINKDKILENRKKDYAENRERYKRKAKEWNKENLEQKKETARKYYIKNKYVIRKRAKEWNLNNKEHVSYLGKKHYKENKENYILNVKEYYEKNKVKIKIYSREYAKEKRKTNPLFKLKCTLRGRTCSAFKYKGYKKDSMTGKMLGVSWEICKASIERQFTKGMNWDNHGEWHIDHIIPLASAKTEKELIKLCHYSNLQPLWAFDNKSKSDNIIGQQNKLRI
tara:strand:- start:282 stop:1073 length:792 start_codon:yes stop_codon:yes gene_type:complete